MRTCEQIINEMSIISTPLLETYLNSLSTFELKSLKEGICQYLEDLIEKNQQLLI